MRVVIFLVMALCACSCSKVTPPPDAIPEGIYQGYDSILTRNDTFSQQMFGACVDIKKDSSGQLHFLDCVLQETGRFEYSFDYVRLEDFGIGDFHAYRKMRRRGVCTFSHNHVIIEYSVGEDGTELSTFRFNGWR